MIAFLILSNLALPFIVGFGIHAFSGSILWAIIGALIITGSASTNIFFALVAYPLAELIFSDTGLSVYSAIYFGVTLSQLAVVIAVTAQSEKGRQSWSVQSQMFSHWKD